MKFDIKLIYKENPKEIIDQAINQYKSWLEGGEHRLLEYVYFRIEGRYHHVIKTIELSKDEMISLYPTLGDWMEKEYTGSSFNFPTFGNDLYSVVEEWVYDQLYKLNNYDEDIIEEWLEKNPGEITDCIYHFLDEVIGSISTDQIK